jgi:hypothetical protein
MPAKPSRSGGLYGLDLADESVADRDVDAEGARKQLAIDAGLDAEALDRVLHSLDGEHRVRGIAPEREGEEVVEWALGCVLQAGKQTIGRVGDAQIDVLRGAGARHAEAEADAPLQDRGLPELGDDPGQEPVVGHTLAKWFELRATTEVAQPLVEGLTERPRRRVGLGLHAASPPKGRSASSTATSSSRRTSPRCSACAGRELQILGREVGARAVFERARRLRHGRGTDERAFRVRHVAVVQDHARRRHEPARASGRGEREVHARLGIRSERSWSASAVSWENTPCRSAHSQNSIR